MGRLAEVEPSQIFEGLTRWFLLLGVLRMLLSGQEVSSKWNGKGALTYSVASMEVDT